MDKEKDIDVPRGAMCIMASCTQISWTILDLRKIISIGPNTQLSI